MYITDTVKYIGVNDHEVDLFEGQYIVPNGMSYNSYVILDEKVAVMDTVDQNFLEPWLRNLEEALEGRKPDYLVVHHMEPTTPPISSPSPRPIPRQRSCPPPRPSR